MSTPIDIPADGKFHGRRGFTLVDTLVSLVVVAILIGLLMPTLRGVNESARRVVCASNVRQIGFGIALYADDHRGFVPSSIFVSAQSRGSMAQEMMTVRLPREQATSPSNQWDGLGLLYAKDYLSAPKIYYCPSHRGSHPYSEYSRAWNQGDSQIVANYHYRGAPNLTPVLFDITPDSTALVADGMRTISDFSHVTGANVLQANLSVRWVSDDSGSFSSLLARNENDAEANKVNNAWEWIDETLGNDSDR